MPISGPFDGLASASALNQLSQDGKHIVSRQLGDIIQVLRANNADGHLVSSGDLYNWSMSKDSWIRSKEGKLLLWIPPDLRSTLWYPDDIAVFNCKFSTRLDFTNCDPGGKWYI